MENQNWEVKKEISIAEMTDAVEKLGGAKVIYQENKKIADSSYEVYKEAENKVMQLLEDSGLDTYTVTGVGKVTVSHQLSVQTPKTPEEKEAFFNWVRREMGEDSYYAYMTVNSQTLNSLYKNMVAEYGADGKVLNIDGLKPATTFTKLSFTKR